MARPLDALVRKAAREADRRHPLLVWIVDTRDPRSVAAVEARVLSDERTALALQRFVCLKGDVRTMPGERVREAARRRTPAFFFFDPAGDLVGTLQRTQARSRSLFTARLTRLWDRSYSMPLRSYVRRRGETLDDLEDVDSRLRIVRHRLATATGNARKSAALRRDERTLVGREERLRRDVIRLVSGVDLRERFFAATPEKDP